MRTLRRWPLIALGIVVGLVVLEGGIRLGALLDPSLAERLHRDTSPESGIILTQWAAHPFLPFVGQPDAEYVTRGSHGTVLRVRNNEYGFRTHPFPPRKEPNERFIVCLGESTTWGSASATNEETWPELLEAKLAARYPELRIRVFNLGVPTGTTAYSLVTLSLLGVRLFPDLVIVYHGANEWGAMMSSDFRYDQAHHFYDFNPESAWYGVRRNLPQFMLSSYAVAYVTALIDESLGVNQMGFHLVKEHSDLNEFPGPGVVASLENLSTMAAVTHGVGGEALFSTFQFYDGKEPSAQKLNQALRRHFEQKGLWFVDQEALLADYDSSINIDAVHFTRKGDELMAQNFYEAIVDRGILEKPPAARKPLTTGFD